MTWPVQTAADVLDATDVAWLRGLAQSMAFADSVEVLRTPYTPSPYGGQTPGTTVVVATVAGLLRERLGPAEQQVAQRLNIARPAVVLLPVGTDVTERDQLRVNGARVFEVSEVAAGGNWALFVTCMCSENL